MSKPPMDSPPGGGARPRYVVRVHRRARPPAPWAWAICEEGRGEPRRRSTRLHRCAEDAWAAGRAVLDRPGRRPAAPAPRP